MICHILNHVKYFDWDEEKNTKLKQERDISFEKIIISIHEGKVLDIIEHPNRRRYPNQKIYIIAINEYAYVVPFVEDEKKHFLKAIIPSRKLTKKYLRGR